ncbi:MAG: TlpA disulfide reductase family protein [Acidobacteriota bacterium]
MLETSDQAPAFSLPQLDGNTIRLGEGKPRLVVFLETDCPTCRLTIPYLNRLSSILGENSDAVIGISQDGERQTRELIEQMQISFPVVTDSDLKVSREYDPVAVPTLFLIDANGKIIRTQTAFDKEDLNDIARLMCEAFKLSPVIIADPYDGAPQSKPGCMSRHLETATEDDVAEAINLYAKRGSRASRIELDDATDVYEYLMQYDPLPVVPPTTERVERMLAATTLPADEIIARVPPNYGAATVEKIAANAVMAGCKPEMMSVLIPLIRAACDERFNLHGVQATTHFAAPLIIVNGPVRHRLGFTCAGNVMSNVSRANSTLGRALQLILTNIGGARPGEIDMSTLGNPGKFSYCIAENEEASPWEPLQVEMGLLRDQSAVTLFAAEPPRGVSEHNARRGETVLKAISRALATSWTYRSCIGIEAIVVLCPEHVKTLDSDGFTKQSIREWLFHNTGIPKKEYTDEGEGTQYTQFYKEAVIAGEPCYLKFPHPSAIKIVVAGGTAGKFSAVISSWAAGERGSQMVTYPV